ncbi:MAG: hypothetical protein KF851_02120 [Pirellulaceae bacterium]|nr:hypothetical protein [Pirellulaceae bacterium]
MAIPDRTITNVSWRDLFPWLCLFQTFSIAFSVTVIAFAALAAVVTPVGWIVAEKTFLTPELITSDPFFQELVEVNRSPYRGILDHSSKTAISMEVWGARFYGLKAVFERITDPFRWLFREELGARKFWYLVVGCLWTLGIWSFSGCCISRYAVVRMARDESLGIDQVWSFGCKRWVNCVLALGACFLVVAAFCIPCFFIGLLLTGDVSSVIGSMLWFIVAVCGTVIAVALVGLLFAWPLMIGSVATEDQNALDAVTRAYAYLYQKPFNYALYALVAVLFGGFCWLIVATIAQTAINSAFWGASWGANLGGEQRIDSYKRFGEAEQQIARGAETVAIAEAGQARSATLEFSTRVIRFWNGMISTLAVSVLYGLFWCQASAVYLLLRYDVDETEMDEVYLEGQPRSYELPPLKSDEQGIPQIQKLEDYQGERGSEDSERLDMLGE